MSLGEQILWFYYNHQSILVSTWRTNILVLATIRGYFLFSGLSLHILWFKISSKIWKMYGIDAFSTYFLVAHHTNNFEHIWFEEKKLKSMMPLGWQASEVLTVCIKYVAQSSRDAGWITIWYFIFLSDFNAIKPPPFW